MASRRRFGRLRKLPSGRWQARYSLSGGRELSAPDTFVTKTAAERWLASIETDLARARGSTRRTARTPWRSTRPTGCSRART